VIIKKSFIWHYNFALTAVKVNAFSVNIKYNLKRELNKPSKKAIIWLVNWMKSFSSTTNARWIVNAKAAIMQPRPYNATKAIWNWSCRKELSSKLVPSRMRIIIAATCNARRNTHTKKLHKNFILLHNLTRTKRLVFESQVKGMA